MKNAPKDPGKPAQVWNALFDGPGYLFGTQPNDYLVEKQDYLKKGQKVLFVAEKVVTVSGVRRNWAYRPMRSICRKRRLPRQGNWLPKRASMSIIPFAVSTNGTGLTGGTMP